LSTLNIEEKVLESSIEAVLFAAGEPVAISRMAQMLEVSENDIVFAATKLADMYSFERRGIRLIRLNDCYQLCSAPEHAELIRKTLETRKPPKLSQSALEALTIVAYYQPTTRAYVDKVRGVDSSYTIGLLQQRGLIEECGRLNVPGRRALFRTTQDFLRVFGLTSLDELPPMPESELLEAPVFAEITEEVEQ